jgi:Flp pilus assembly protein CpaB
VSTASEALVPPGRSRIRRRVVIVTAGLALSAAFLAGYLPRRLSREKLVAATPTAPVAPRVAVVKAVSVEAGRQLTLPAGT